MSELIFDIEPQIFREDFLTQFPISGTKPISQLIRELVFKQIESYLSNQVISGKVFKYNIKFNREEYGYSLRKALSLRELIQKDCIDLGYVTIEITTDDSVTIQNPKYLQWLYPIEIKSQQLKTRTKHSVRIRSFGFQTLVISNVSSLLMKNCQCQPELLVPHIDGVWDWAIRFICKTCGKSYYCECFRKALDIYHKKAVSDYSRGGTMIRQFIENYKETGFRSGICHLCQDINSDIFYCHPMYGSKVMVHYGPYIMRVATEKNISQYDAENEIRDILGIPRINEGWISEVDLLNIIRNIFNDEEVLHQSSPNWLGRQRFDIFIPTKKIAIEYQGRQHYEPVQYFGGEEAFKKTQELDKQKARLCFENGVNLVYFRFDEEITAKTVEKRLKNFIT